MSQVILEPYTAKLHWCFDPPRSAVELEDFLGKTFEILARRCVESGASLIGHIKGFAAPSNRHFIKVSVTGPSEPAQLDGRLPDDCRELILTINVHVYGLSHGAIGRLVEQLPEDSDLPRIGRVRIEAEHASDHIHAYNHLNQKES